MDTKYLSQGKTEYTYYVHHGYAYTLTADGAGVLATKTDLHDGVYTQDGPADDVIADVMTDKLSRPVLFMPNATVMQLIHSILEKCQELGLSAFKPVLNLPKLNKAVADGMDRILEPMGFVESAQTIEYLCMGARSRIEKLVDNTAWVSPLKFYLSSAFKEDKFGRINKFYLMVTDANLEHIGIMFTIDLEKRDEAIKNLQVENA